jgi:TonB dependent receptor-like, beta-barrel/Carboxypeptidase regulatory-like domain/TonB-dependent Receptor Plug Domain
MVLVLLLSGLPAQAAVRVEGRVVEAFSGQPVEGAVVRAGELATATDAGGRFVLELPGPGTIEASAPGHLNASRRLEASASDVILYLLERHRFQDEVEVTAAAGGQEAPEVLPVAPRDVSAVAGGAENVFRVVQLLPGVSGTDEFDGRLAVRGGSPDQNLTVLDGVEIHNPYRLLGLVSAFNPETVQGFELTAGAFEARYGDRLSSLLVVRSRYGTENRRLAGSSALSVTDANVVLEGKLPQDAPGSWLISGRRTYYDLIANRFVDGSLPAFTDLQGKLGWQPRAGQRLTVLGLRSREASNAVVDGDRPGEQGAFVTAARNDLLAATFQSTLGSHALLRTILGVYRNVDQFDVDALFRNTSRRSNAPGEDDGFAQANVAFQRDLGVRDLSLRQEFAYQANDRHLLEAGAELHRLTTDVAWRITGDRNTDEGNGSSVRGGTGLPDALDSSLGSSRWGVFVQDRVQMMERVVLEPGLRLEGNSVAGSASLQPRLAARVRLSSGTRLRAALGRHQQSPGYEKLITSDYFVDLTDAASLDLRNERSDQAVLGLEHDFGTTFSVRAEGYVKRLDRLIVGELESEAQRATRLRSYDFPAELQDSVPAEAQITTFPTNGGSGRAHGLDLYLARRPGSGPLSGWLSYTWSKAERTSYGLVRPFEYDRRHAASAVVNWSAARWLEIGATARLASGFPRTPVLGLRVAATPDTNDGDGDGNRTELVPERDAAGRLVYTTDVGGVPNLESARLPGFARLDLRFTFRPKGTAGRWSLYLDILNATNRHNAGIIESQLAYDPASDRPRIVEKRSASIPFLPSLGVHFRF